MRSGRAMWVLVAMFVSLALCVGPAAAQFSVLGGGGDEPDKASAVRIGEDDPVRIAQKERDQLLQRQQAMVLRNAKTEKWRERLKAVKKRRSDLVEKRKALIQASEPTREARIFHVAMVEPVPGLEVEPEVSVDGGAGDGGVGDGGVGDGGVGDGGAGDGGVGDGGAGDGGVGDGGAGDGGAGDGGAGDGGAGDGGAQVVPPPEAAPEFLDPNALKPDERLLPVLKVDEFFLRPGVHPGEVAEIDGLIAAVSVEVETLTAMMRLHSEEATHIAEGVSFADKLLEAYKNQGHEPPFVDEADRPGLVKTEKLALKVHLTRIDVSLARARERQSGAENAQDLAVASDSLDSLEPLESGTLEPWEAYTDSFRSAELYRDQNEEVRHELDKASAELARVRAPVHASRTAKHNLEMMVADKTLADQEQTLNAALERMVVRDAEVADVEARLAKSKKRRAASIRRLQESLDRLRSNQRIAGRERGKLGSDQVRAVAGMFISERLVFERAKLERDEFRYALAVQLQAMLQDVAPDPAFRTKWHALMIEAEFQNRKDDLKTRCDGWRRRQNSVERAKPKEKRLVENRVKMLESYEKLADVCMREEWVLGTEARLGDIARYHIKAYQLRARGAWYYVWRGALSLAFALLGLVVTRWIGRVTRMMAGQLSARLQEASSHQLDEEGAVEKQIDTKSLWQIRLHKVRAMIALMIYLTGVVGSWSGVIIAVGNNVWHLPITLDTLLGLWVQPIFFVGERGVSAWSFSQVVFWVICSVYSGRMVQSFIADLLEHFTIERGIRDTVGTLMRYLTVAAGVALALDSVGIPLGALAAVFAVIGLGIGFGLQNIASNFISGFIILLERPIRKGDFIQLGDMIGEVKSISARATVIETRDAVSIIVPNAEFISDRVINWTLGNSERVRAQVSVGVAYGSDVALVKRILMTIAVDHPAVLRWPRPAVNLTNFGDSSLDFVLHVWTDRIRMLPDTISDLNLKVDERFREHGIEIPFPQRDYNIRGPLSGEPGDEGGD